ncbi:hypothetical protein C8J55DRAFT_556279 [Lentinula edodes]|uniref:J domain-containing protein n=1 Tax=Lentinula lateritia TaxID=40482 RepID=A0A9W9AW68_9AGAR|nr:hypothetical protein C8J55DRAFT_556279 [Lentinula edodes]
MPRALQKCQECGCLAKDHKREANTSSPNSEPASNTAPNTRFSPSSGVPKSTSGPTSFHQAASDRKIETAADRLRQRLNKTMEGVGSAGDIDPAVMANVEAFKNSHSRPLKKKKRKSFGPPQGDSETTKDPDAIKRLKKDVSPISANAVLITNTPAIDKGILLCPSPSDLLKKWNVGLVQSITLNPDDQPLSIRAQISAKFEHLSPLVSSFRYLYREANGAGRPTMLRVVSRGKYLAIEDIRVLLDHGYNQATRKLSPRLFICLDIGYDVLAINGFQSPVKCISHPGDDEDSNDIDLQFPHAQAQEQSQTKSATTKSPTHSLSPSPTQIPSPQVFQSENSDSDFGTEDIVDMSGCQIKKLVQKLYYITSPSEKSVEWWPMKPSGVYLALYHIIQRLQGQLHKAEQRDSAFFVRIIQEAFEVDDLFSFLRSFNNLAKLIENEPIEAFKGIQLGPHGIRSIAEVISKVEPLLILHESSLKSTEKRTIHQAYKELKEVTCSLIALIDLFFVRVSRGDRSPPGFSELFNTMDNILVAANIALYLSFATEDNEYGILGYDPNERDAHRSPGFWRTRLESDFGSADDASKIPFRNIRRGAFGLAGLRTYLESFLDSVPLPTTALHNKVFDIFSKFCIALAARLKELKNYQKKDYEYVEVSDDDDQNKEPLPKKEKGNKGSPYSKPRPTPKPTTGKPSPSTSNHYSVPATQDWKEELDKLEKKVLPNNRVIKGIFRTIYHTFDKHPNRNVSWLNIVGLDTRAQFLELAKIFHPDKGGKEWEEKNNRIMQVLNLCKDKIQ